MSTKMRFIGPYQLFFFPFPFLFSHKKKQSHHFYLMSVFSLHWTLMVFSSVSARYSVYWSLDFCLWNSMPTYLVHVISIEFHTMRTHTVADFKHVPLNQHSSSMLNSVCQPNIYVCQVGDFGIYPGQMDGWMEINFHSRPNKIFRTQLQINGIVNVSSPFTLSFYLKCIALYCVVCFEWPFSVTFLHLLTGLSQSCSSLLLSLSIASFRTFTPSHSFIRRYLTSFYCKHHMQLNWNHVNWIL